MPAGGLDHPVSQDEIVRSSYLTPDMETGIGNKSKENFVGLLTHSIQKMQKRF